MQKKREISKRVGISRKKMLVSKLFDWHFVRMEEQEEKEDKCQCKIPAEMKPVNPLLLPHLLNPFCGYFFFAVSIE